RIASTSLADVDFVLLREIAGDRPCTSHPRHTAGPAVSASKSGDRSEFPGAGHLCRDENEFRETMKEPGSVENSGRRGSAHQ
ncbi:MAG TPA: hypothetical protein VNS88_11535, partial [Nitrospiraceae bacterium]|nr:hypothetical protein [Nitrospiraceae bacterium]